MKTRTTQLNVAPEWEPIFSERSYTVMIEYQAAGEYVEVGSLDDQGGKIAIDPENWDDLRSAIDQIIKECQS